MLLDGIEAVLFAQRIDKRDLRRVRPNLREKLQVDRVYGFGIPLNEVMDLFDLGGRPGILLGSGATGTRKVIAASRTRPSIDASFYPGNRSHEI
jgi:hypothetical protein